MIIEFPYQPSYLYCMDIIAVIVRSIYESASSMVGSKDLYAAITYPSSFCNHSIQQLIYAIELSGFKVIAMYPESIAAAYSILTTLQSPLQIFSELGNEYNIIVYDFGGYTFDCSAIHVCNNRFELIDYSCQKYIGGYYLGQDILKEANPNLQGKELKEEIRLCMKYLNNTRSCIYLSHSVVPPELSRKHILKYVNQTETLIDSLLKNMNLNLKTALFFVGGMCNCPFIRQEIREHYPFLIIKEHNSFLYDVAQGALLLGEQIVNAHDSGLDLSKCIHQQKPLPYDVVVIIGGEKRIINQPESNDRINPCIIELNIDSNEPHKLSIQSYYDHPMNKEKYFIINETINVADRVTFAFKCWIDITNIVHIIVESSTLAYNAHYQGFAIQHITKKMKKGHVQRIEACTNAYMESEKKQKTQAHLQQK